MNESIRTLVYVAVGALAVLAAYASRPPVERSGPGVEPLVGKPLFPDFKDPLAARSLEIKQFDEATARARTFVVAQQPSGQWVIPSHGNYPADAESQLKAVAETLSGLTVLDVASELATDHAYYGVLDPDKAEVGSAGVGALIAMQDAKGNDLLRLIVGKEVEKRDREAPNQRFVRKPSQEQVYVATIDLSKLPTEFDKWIEKDLLKLSTFDVAKVTLKDYAVLPTQAGYMQVVRRMDAATSYDSSKGEWTLDNMAVFSQGRSRESGLGDHEELNRSKLDELRTALGDVKIVDVRRKPEGLGGRLRVSKDSLSDEQQAALQQYGFFANPAADGSLDIYGSNGEVLVDTKDGVQYVLRFGNIAPQTEIGGSTASANGAKGEEEKVKINRYLFVTTQLAPSILKEPDYEPEPAGPPAESKPDEAEKKEDDTVTGDEQPEAKPIDPAQAERERIKKENERKRNEYRDKRLKAENRVRELNSRFADWYYVVSEDVYKKIRLVRSDIVKEAATAKEEGFGIDAFRKLEEEGLKGAGAGKPATP